MYAILVVALRNLQSGLSFCLSEYETRIFIDHISFIGIVSASIFFTIK